MTEPVPPVNEAPTRPTCSCGRAETSPDMDYCRFCVSDMEEEDFRRSQEEWVFYQGSDPR